MTDGSGVIWCRACGSDLEVSTATCSACGTALVGPDAGDPRIGLVVTVGRALFKKSAIAIAVSPDSVTVVAKDEETTPIALAEFDAMTKVDVPGPAVHSPAGRLWRAVVAVAGNLMKAGWSAQLLDSRAWEIGRTDLGTLRATTIDRCALGLECDTSYLPLTATEIDWYRAWAAAQNGADDALLSTLAALPPGKYLRRFELVLHRAHAIAADPALSARCVEALKPITDVHPLAGALSSAFLDIDAPVPQDGLERFAADTARRAGVPANSLVGVATAAATLGRVGELPASPMPYLAAMDAYVAGKNGADLNDALPLVTALPLECLDELVDVSALTQLKEGARPWHGKEMSYLECRIQPGETPDDILREVGFSAELARRAMIRADRGALLELPQNDADVRHYSALLTLKDDPAAGALPDGLRPDVLGLLGRARETAAAGLNGPISVSDEIVGDSTLWPLLRKSAELGNLTPSNRQHPLAEAFSVWAELCGLQRKLFDRKWSEVVSGGSDLARRTTHEAFADEAQNMAAYACLQLGRVDDALKLIEEALAGEFTTGLVVNAALVSSSRGGSRAAMPYLARVVSLADTTDVRNAAVWRAVQLWLDDPLVQGYPDDLARIVRDALVSDQDDEFYLELIRLTAYNDAEWLAEAKLRPGSPAQKDMAAYFQSRSRTVSSKNKATYADLCRDLARLLGRTPVAPWLQREREKQIDMLMDGVHCDFGEAPGFALGIDELVQANVLNLFEQLILAPQACAHLAAALNKQNQELSDVLERRLLLDSVRLYRSRRTELNQAQDEIVRDDMARCSVVTTLHFMGAASRERDAMADAYNELVARLRWDTQNFHVIQNRKRAVLDSFDPYLTRGRELLAAVDNFDLNDGQRNLRNEAYDLLRRWSNESDDLRRSL